jgi:CheY-like chemotaxis protein
MMRQHCPVPGRGPVLLVEDDPAAREATRRLLEKLGLVVAEAANGAEGLAWLDANGAPSLILLDLMMPVMDGFAFLGEMQNQPRFRDVPIVVLTGKQLTAEERRALSGRTEQVLAKEATLDAELIEAIRKCLLRSRVTRPRQGGDIRPTPRVA